MEYTVYSIYFAGTLFHENRQKMVYIFFAVCTFTLATKCSYHVTYVTMCAWSSCLHDETVQATPAELVQLGLQPQALNHQG